MAFSDSIQQLNGIDSLIPHERIDRPSYGDIQAHLGQMLHANGRELLMKDFNQYVPTDMSLEDVAKQLAESYFSKEYHYEYHELEASNIRPPTCMGGNWPTRAFCLMDPSKGSFSTQLRDLLERARCIPDEVLPGWVEGSVRNDLMEATDFIDDETMNRWKYRKHAWFYDPNIEGEDSYQCDVIMVYCHGVAQHPQMEARIGLVYFAGVYYTVPAERKKTYDLMCAEAMEAAAAISETGTYIPCSMEELKEILEVYADHKFRAEHGHRYTEDPPTSQRTIERSAILERGSGLIKTREEDLDLRTFIDDLGVFRGDGMYIPDAIRERMIDDVFKQHMSLILDTGKTWSWKTTPFDEAYVHVANGVPFKCRQTGVLVSRRSEKDLGNGVKIVVVHIYSMIVVYEVMRAKDQLSREMFNKLNEYELVPKGYSLKLEHLLSAYAEKTWNDLFGFKFEHNATQLPDMVTPRRVMTFATPFMLEDFPNSILDVERWMDRTLFKRDSSTFPPGVNSELYDYAKDHIFSYRSGDTNKSVNTWHEVKLTKAFTLPAPRTNLKVLKYYGLFVYAIGEVANDMIAADSNADVRKIRRLFGYYILAVGGMAK